MLSELDMTAAGLEFTKSPEGRVLVQGPESSALDLRDAVAGRMDLVRGWLLANRRGLGRPDHRYGECESCRQPIPDHRGGNCWICCCCIQKILDEERGEDAEDIKMETKDERDDGADGVEQEPATAPAQVDEETSELAGLDVEQRVSAVAILRDLNPEQRRVATHGSGPCLVSACAGSGKTTAVVRRMAWLVRVAKVPADRIFGTTFSRKAAAEMNDRIKRLLGDDTMVQVQTFHAFSRRVLAEEFPGFRNWRLDERDEYREILKRAVGYEHINWRDADIEDLMSYIELCKAAAYWPDSREAAELAQKRYDIEPSEKRDPRMNAAAYARAEELRSEKFLMTFSDWMMIVARLFEDENIRGRWAALFDYVMVDEAQDNSLVQMMIADALARDHKNLMLVGDGVQSIYRWRGAAPEYFNGFPQKWGAPVISMFRNYRSVKPVVDFANEVLHEMKPGDRVDDVDMECERAGQTGDVSVRSFETPSEEAEGIINHMQSLHVDEVPWSKMVVLYRVNAMSRAIEEELNAKAIPYQIVGSVSFYLRKEVAILLCYLKVAWRKTATIDDVRRSLFAPHRMLGKAFFAKFEEVTRTKPGSFTSMVDDTILLAAETKRLNSSQSSKARQWAGLMDWMRHHITKASAGEWTDNDLPPWNPAVLLRQVVKTTQFVEWLRKDEGRETPDNDRASNVAELIRIAEQFNDVGAFLQHVTEQITAARERKDDESPDCVTLMSIHRSKGLEWPNVFLIACNESVLPHFYAEDIEEERRLFYVAATRAMDHLNVSYYKIAASKGTVRSMTPSRFLEKFIPREKDLLPRNPDELEHGDRPLAQVIQLKPRGAVP